MGQLKSDTLPDGKQTPIQTCLQVLDDVLNVL